MKEQLAYDPIELPQKGIGKFFRGAFTKGSINKTLAARGEDYSKLWEGYASSIWKPTAACISRKFSYCNERLIPADKLSALLSTDELNDMSVVELIMSLESEFNITFDEEDKLDGATIGELVSLIASKRE